MTAINVQITSCFANVIHKARKEQLTEFLTFCSFRFSPAQFSEKRKYGEKKKKGLHKSNLINAKHLGDYKIKRW